MSDTSLVFTIIGRDKSAAALGSASARISKLKTGLLVGFGGITAAVGSSINKAAEFDKTIRQVGANANIQGTALKDMSNLALKMGADTSFSAQQAAQAMLELSKAGLTPAQVKAGALANTLTLAAAGELELADSATIMSNALAAFGLKAEDSAKVAAALAGGANASTASVSSLAEGLGNVGATAKQAGLSINDTVAILAEFDQSAIKGAEGGTQLKSMLLRLLAPQAAGAKMMKEIGFSARDAAGHMKPLGQIADDLAKSLSGMGQAQKDAALKTIFGTYAIQGANTLLGQGSKKLAEYKKATLDMGAAQRMAKTNTSGAAGAFEQFHGAIESLQIAFGLHLLPVVTSVTRQLTGLINVVGGQVDPAMRRLSELAHTVAPAFNKVRDAVKGALAGIDFSGISSSLMTSSKGWAQSIISGIQQGFDSGDWTGLSKSLGNGLGSALAGSAELATTLFVWIGAQIRKIKWVDLGVQMGRQAPSLLAGLAIGILNFDIGSLLSGLGDHWFEALLGALTIAFAPLKVGGVVERLLTKIPLGGALLWGLRVVQKMTKGLLTGLGRLGVEFVAGGVRALESAFPRLAGVVERGLIGLVHILTGGGPRIGAAVTEWGRKMVGALASVPGRLASRGGEAVGGFLSGILRGVGKLDGWLGGWGARIVGMVGDTIGLLKQKGIDLVQGFINGIVEKAKDLPGVVGGLGKKAVGWLGNAIKSRSPSRLTLRLGQWFSQGFAIGIKDKTADVMARAKELTDKLKAKIDIVKDFAKTIRETFAQSGNVTSFQLGGLEPSLLNQLAQQADHAQRFAEGLTKLRKMGLNSTTLSQLRDAGPEAGYDAMAQLLNGTSITDVNRLVGQINRAGKALSDRESRAEFGFAPGDKVRAKVRAGEQKVTITLDAKGADQELLKVLRKLIRVQGGNVQAVLGK